MSWSPPRSPDNRSGMANHPLSIARRTGQTRQAQLQDVYIHPARGLPHKPEAPARGLLHKPEAPASGPKPGVLTKTAPFIALPRAAAVCRFGEEVLVC